MISYLLLALAHPGHGLHPAGTVEHYIESPQHLLGLLFALAIPVAVFGSRWLMRDDDRD